MNEIQEENNMQCQREGCDETAIYGVQVLNARGYRIGLCKECTKDELEEIGINFRENFKAISEGKLTECCIILVADWWRGWYTYNTWKQVMKYVGKEKCPTCR